MRVMRVFAPLLLFAAVALCYADKHELKITISGTVSKVEFINPHSYVTLDVKDPSGKMVKWSFELAGPGSLKRSGMSREDRGGMKPGDPLTILCFPAKDGSNFGFVQEIHFADGRVFVLDNRDPYAN